jgi:hypothetical protein
VRAFVRGFRQVLPLYCALNFVPLVVLNLWAFLKHPFSQALSKFLSATQSAVFIGCFVQVVSRYVYMHVCIYVCIDLCVSICIYGVSSSSTKQAPVSPATFCAATTATCTPSINFLYMHSILHTRLPPICSPDQPNALTVPNYPNQVLAARHGGWAKHICREAAPSRGAGSQLFMIIIAVIFVVISLGSVHGPPRV